MASWQIWMIVGVLMFIGEIFTPGFLLACLGLGCFAAGVAALLGAGITVQAISFIVVSLIIFFGVRPFFLRHFYRAATGVKTNVDALVGKTGIVTQTIDPLTSSGRVNVGGEDWRGMTEGDAKIEAGTRISVVKVDGTKLIVKENS